MVITMMTKTRRIVEKAHHEFMCGNYKKTIKKLINYADKHVRNKRTRRILDSAIEEKKWCKEAGYKEAERN